ncbi:hypothetical protein KFL_010870010 [Klebsormidium nitens]|uniref:Alpha N-terminal protein methyltransferase 1 n=1 Tax=Klebsormidium nitens TaxID=105231 RepID=A0A1Y1IPJ1_KLENI|nr:hypothetical protein KFL_010870010 [Klebsormidium nitens]|eukprot:GAQ92664.1 hypothetical protein KFL_010870010 [Klebsormidium nitens]
MISPIDEPGTDNAGNPYTSAKEMWRLEAGEGDEAKEKQKKEEWYRNGVAYWENVEASVDGVLGGYGHVSSVDIAESEAFLKETYGARLVETGDQPLRALDCGAGVGRISKNLLLKHFHKVDLLEPARHFLDAARVSLSAGPSGEGAEGTSGHRAVNFFYQGAQEFTPEAGRYDVIWVQWFIGHLTDQDFVNFFQRAKDGLKPGGIFILKENTAHSGFVVDKEDHSITRSHPYFLDLFKRAGMQVHRTKLQNSFPKELFKVRMYAVSPEGGPPLPAPLPKKQYSTRQKSRANLPGRIS